ncbi:hypothetical protein BBK82_32170 [Lentzea guizhouensis]|uniref:DUF4760 domain-containing protein n=1 Tax=Lentzea guizhouensis TaxID=1586287 RepID=A0A1B2HQL0_9PSEU|nr:hypothetical protein [Lentzea guizhouensis]ANZ40008.1 hypothetical protein BBK82_32170 [Lentzea guizhouensis]
MALGELLRALIGPITGAIVGTLVLGGFITWVNHNVQTRRANRELRGELVTQTTDAAGSFHFLATYFHGMKQTSPADHGYLEVVRQELGGQYRRSRVAGKALESRLQAYFPEDDLHEDWHALMDICSVLYFQLVDSPADRIERIFRQGAVSEVERHTGFSLDELRAKSIEDLLDDLWRGLTELASRLLAAKIART